MSHRLRSSIPMRQPMSLMPSNSCAYATPTSEGQRSDCPADADPLIETNLPDKSTSTSMKNQLAWGELITKILFALKTYGPMTRAELEQQLNLPKEAFGGCLGRMARSTPTIPQRIHISGYTRDHEGARRYLRPVYSFGPGENKPKPTGYRKKERVAYYRSQINRVRNASVFNLGLTRDTIREMKKNVRPAEVHMGQGS